MPEINAENLDDTLEIGGGATVTIPAGQVWKGLYGHGRLVVHGSLVAQGTSGSPVTFTSERDDSVGGDTDGSGTTPAPVMGGDRSRGRWVCAARTRCGELRSGWCECGWCSGCVLVDELYGQ